MATTPADQLAKLAARLDSETLTKEDFVRSFTLVVKQIQDLRTSNETEWGLIHSGLQLLEARLTKANATDITQIQKEAKTLIQSQISAIDTKLRTVDAKLATVQNGKDADEQAIIDSVMAQIIVPETKEQIVDTPEDIRNKLELLKEEERLDASAIKNLPEAIKATTRIIGSHGPLYSLADVNLANLTTGQFLKWDGVQWVPGTAAAGGGFTTLTATETPNGTLKVFTFSGASAQPSFIISDNVMMQATTKAGTVNWTWSSGPKQATMTIAPIDDILGIV